MFCVESSVRDEEREGKGGRNEKNDSRHFVTIAKERTDVLPAGHAKKKGMERARDLPITEQVMLHPGRR